MIVIALNLGCAVNLSTLTLKVKSCCRYAIGYGSVTVALAMAGKLGITAAFSVLYISTAEQFPTVVRGMGMGICSMCSKIGSTISPFFPYFSE